ncbi:MAG: SprT family zinc-dependent metalloprotease [Bacilli bacterium]|nr:SprT family zinc-dependent metalloprotease [Bacilli bacterium]
MELNINGVDYKVKIIRKHNKNTYIRVKEDLNIYITTSLLATNKFIEKLINDNIHIIEKMINRELKKQEKAKEIYYLGNKYDLVIISGLENVKIKDNKIFTNSKEFLSKWYLNEAKVVFLDRFNYLLTVFKDNLPTINLRIRKMKTRWGVCNRKNNTVTLNLELIKKDIGIIDYVIVHELCHFIYPNHSKEFWDLVNSYIPNYRELRNKLKEI